MEAAKNLFDQVNTLLTEQFGALGPLLVVGVLGMFLVLLTLPIVLKKEKDPFDQIRKAARAEAAGDMDKKARLRRGRGKGVDKLEKYSSFLEPQDEKAYSETRLKLLQAGYRSKDAVRTFLGFLLSRSPPIATERDQFITAHSGACMLPTVGRAMLMRFDLSRRGHCARGRAQELLDTGAVISDTVLLRGVRGQLDFLISLSERLIAQQRTTQLQHGLDQLVATLVRP